MTFFFAHEFERAHVVQSIGELDQNDADIFRHRKEHFAIGLELLIFLRFERDAPELGDAVDERGNLGTEHILNLVELKDGVLDHIMQEGGGDRFVVEVQFGQDLSDLQRVIDIGFAGGALLFFVPFLGDEVGALDQL